MKHLCFPFYLALSLICSGIVFSSSLQAQACVSIDSLQVMNDTLYECDSIRIRLLGSTCASPALMDSSVVQSAGSLITLNAFFQVTTSAVFDQFDLTVTLSPMEPGTYTLNGQMQWGPSFSAAQTTTFTVLAGEPNDQIFMEPFEEAVSRFCPGESLMLDAGNPGKSYRWSNGTDAPQLLAEEPGWYWVQVMDEQCNKTLDSIYVEHWPVDRLDLGVDQQFCPYEGEGLELSAPGWMEYNWFPGGEATSTIDLYDGGTFALSATDFHGCTSSDTVEVEALCLPALFVPKAFSPNGDQLNDIFFPQIGEVAAYQFLVYNRFGELIFESGSPGEGWDGNLHGQPAPVGTYAWQLRYSTGYDFSADGVTFEQGSVTLIR